MFFVMLPSFPPRNRRVQLVSDIDGDGVGQWTPCLYLMTFKARETLWTLRRRHTEQDGVSNHRYLDCLLNRLYGRRSKKISKLRVTGLCEGNSPVTGEFLSQRASNAENLSIWWRHHEQCLFRHFLIFLWIYSQTMHMGLPRVDKAKYLTPAFRVLYLGDFWTKAS